jgi:hypothetical protein
VPATSRILNHRRTSPLSSLLSSTSCTIYDSTSASPGSVCSVAPIVVAEVRHGWPRPPPSPLQTHPRCHLTRHYPYLLSQYLTALIYYRTRGIPNYVLFLLPLSKRLHYIPMLRLFNDSWASTAALASVYSYSAGNELTGTILYRSPTFLSLFLL